jgi:adenine-specific DNA-methyltransferase
MQNSLFKNKTLADEQKLRGGYYTPVALARYLTTWALRTGNERVLEPSCGDGNFVVAALGRLAELSSGRKKRKPELVAVEIVESELEKAQTRAAAYVFSGLNTEWVCEDFFTAYQALRTGEKFDVVVGNPPFIRFQYFGADSRDQAFSSLRDAGYSPNKLANAWAAFVQLSIELLKDGGRLALVVPAELLQVGYAHELRERLGTSFQQVTIVGFRQLVFPEIQQEVVLLLAEGKRAPRIGQLAEMHTLEFANGESLPSEHSFVDAVSHAPEKYNRNGMKWTSLFLDNDLFSTLSAVEDDDDFDRLGELASVDVGVVTGRNSFFVIGNDAVQSMNAEEFTLPIVGRTSALKSIIFKPTDFKAHAAKHPSHLLDLKGHTPSSMPKRIRQYLEVGEAEGVNKGYKCRIRKRWYDVPSIYAPDGFMYRQIHTFPMVVANRVGATSTDTVHRVRLRSSASIEEIAFRAFNSLTFAWSEVCGRSYGGGVLELEPKEAEELPLPRAKITKTEIRELDRLQRLGDTTKALNFADDILLREGMGLSAEKIDNLRRSWEALRDRRILRK